MNSVWVEEDKNKGINRGIKYVDTQVCMEAV